MGWDAHNVGQAHAHYPRVFTVREQSMHINALELLGCWYTIRALLPLAVPQQQWARVHLSCELSP